MSYKIRQLILCLMILAFVGGDGFGLYYGTGIQGKGALW
jgi:hypothetical protein